MIQRIPIILFGDMEIKRTPIFKQVFLSNWDECLSKFENFVKYAAKQVGSTNSSFDSSFDTQDLYQEGMIVLFECWNKYKHKPESEFKTIFAASLFRHLHKKVKRVNAIIIDLDSDDIADVSFTEEQFESVFFEYSLLQLYELLEDDEIAKLILKEITHPSERTLWEVTMDAARKSMLFNQGQKVNLVVHYKVKFVHIRRALDLTQKQFDEGINRLKIAAKSIFCTDATTATA